MVMIMTIIMIIIANHSDDDHHHHDHLIIGIQTERSAQHQLSQQQEHWRAAMEHNKQVSVVPNSITNIIITNIIITIIIIIVVRVIVIIVSAKSVMLFQKFTF